MEAPQGDDCGPEEFARRAPIINFYGLPKPPTRDEAEAEQTAASSLIYSPHTEPDGTLKYRPTEEPLRHQAMLDAETERQ